ncbi:hypothetical protein VTK56DRAFT_7533 [Thermocarpiscus australiensis]
MAVSWLTALAQGAGVALPLLCAGITFQYSLTMCILAQTSPPKLLAKQWLRLYQLGPYWVSPLLLLGALANAYLAWLARDASTSPPSPYSAAAVLALSVLASTFVYFEPGVNGACKWKAQDLLAEEGFRMPAFSGVPSARRHSATAASRAWAARADMRELVLAWARRNHARWVVALGAGMLSLYAVLGGR